MASSTTHSEFDAKTDALTVAKAFPNSIKGKTILITGVNRKGIGYTTAQAFASQGARLLIFAGRSASKLEECITDLKKEYARVEYRALELDVSSQASARKAAAEVNSWTDVPSIDLVINNAGVMNLPHSFTPEGVEMHLATNHLGHFIFTNGIAGKLIEASKKAQAAGANPGSVRVVNLASMGIYASGIRFSDLRWEKPDTAIPEDERPNHALTKAFNIDVPENEPYFPAFAYSASKTAAVLFSIGLNERLFRQHGILALSVNPGEIRTELGRNSDPEYLRQAYAAFEAHGSGFKTQEQGAATSLVAATDPGLSVPSADGVGAFLQDCQVNPKAPLYATDPVKVAKLWALSEEWAGEKFDY